MDYSSSASKIEGNSSNFNDGLISLDSIAFDGVWSGAAHDNLTSDLSAAIENAKAQINEVKRFVGVLGVVQLYKSKKERLASVRYALDRCDPETQQSAISSYNAEIADLNASISELKEIITSELSSFSSASSDVNSINFLIDKSYKSSADEVNNSVVEGISVDLISNYRSGGSGYYSSGVASAGSSGGGYTYYSGGSSGGSGSGSSSSGGDITRPLSELEDTDGEFINYYQYNYKESYGYGTTISSSGCGPTAMAMVLTKLTGKKVSPVDTANWSLNNGYRIPNCGTAWAYFGALAPKYGVSCKQMGVTRENIINNLKAGKILIMSMGPGDFTRSGHYIVLRGITEDGRIIVSDPNSEKRSNQTWDISVFLSQGSQVWAFS